MKYRVYVSFWFFGNSKHSNLVKEYEAESEKEAKEKFWDDYPAMLGTGTIDKVELI